MNLLSGIIRYSKNRLFVPFFFIALICIVKIYGDYNAWAVKMRVAEYIESNEFPSDQVHSLTVSVGRALSRFSQDRSSNHHLLYFCFAISLIRWRLVKSDECIHKHRNGILWFMFFVILIALTHNYHQMLSRQVYNALALYKDRFQLNEQEVARLALDLVYVRTKTAIHIDKAFNIFISLGFLLTACRWIWHDINNKNTRNDN